LDVDVKNEGPSKAACTDIIKKGLRQQRYHLKRKYYDSSLTKEQLLARDPPGKMKRIGPSWLSTGMTQIIRSMPLHYLVT